MTLATNNVAEFGRVSGLLVEDWGKAFDSRFSVNFFAQAKKGDQLTSESMSCRPLSRRTVFLTGDDIARNIPLPCEFGCGKMSP